MKISSSILAFASVALLSTTAFAADLPARVVKPGIAPAASCFWAGPYVGAQVGYTWNNVKTNYRSVGPAGTVDNPDGPVANSDHNKITGGVYGGYNFCVSPGFVAGVELDATKFGNAPKRDTRNLGSTAFGFNHYDTNFGGSAVVRLGATVDRALFYVKGGIGIADQKAYNVIVNNAGVISSRGVASKTGVGYVLGAGVDYAFTNNWIGRLGYTYFDGGKLTTPVGGAWKSSYHTVNLGLAYKF